MGSIYKVLTAMHNFKNNMRTFAYVVLLRMIASVAQQAFEVSLYLHFSLYCRICISFKRSNDLKRCLTEWVVTRGVGHHGCVTCLPASVFRDSMQTKQFYSYHVGQRASMTVYSSAESPSGDACRHCRIKRISLFRWGVCVCVLFSYSRAATIKMEHKQCVCTVNLKNTQVPS